MMDQPPIRPVAEKPARRQLRELRQARRNRPRRIKGYGQHVIYAGGRCEGCGWHMLDIALYAERIWACPATEKAQPDASHSTGSAQKETP